MSHLVAFSTVTGLLLKSVIESLRGSRNLIMKTIALALVAMLLASPAYAGGKGGGNNKNYVSEGKKKRLARQAEREKLYLAAEAFMKSKDVNGDGSLNREEFILGESDQAATEALWDEANKNRDRCLTISEISKVPELVKKAPENKKK